MDEGKTRLEGRVVSAELTGSQNIDNHLPYVRFSIKNDSGKEESNEMPMNVGDGQLIKGAFVGQTAIYEHERKHTGKYMHITKAISITSGQCKGVHYEYTEEY